MCTLCTIVSLIVSSIVLWKSAYMRSTLQVCQKGECMGALFKCFCIWPQKNTYVCLQWFNALETFTLLELTEWTAMYNGAASFKAQILVARNTLKSNIPLWAWVLAVSVYAKPTSNYNTKFLASDMVKLCFCASQALPILAGSAFIWVFGPIQKMEPKVGGGHSFTRLWVCR